MSQVDLLIRDEKTEKFFEYAEELHLEGQVAYRLLVELPRFARRKGLAINGQIIDRIAAELAQGKITLPQITGLVENLSREPHLSLEDAIKKIRLRTITETEIKNLVSDQLDRFDVDKIGQSFFGGEAYSETGSSHD
jgi:Glu-tRNA(Gln) amidotransferase subunit E-like FAD-binding protein